MCLTAHGCRHVSVPAALRATYSFTDDLSTRGQVEHNFVILIILPVLIYCSRADVPIYMALCQYTWLCANVHGSVPMYTVLCQCTCHCTSVLDSVPIYMALCQCTWLCANIHGYVPIYTALCQCTRYYAKLRGTVPVYMTL